MSHCPGCTSPLNYPKSAKFYFFNNEHIDNSEKWINKLNCFREGNATIAVKQVKVKN